MARPIHSNSIETRQRMIRAASALFAQYGQKGTSVRAIATQSSVNVAMISHYFGSKQGLYQACLEELYRELDRGKAFLFASLSEGKSPRALILQTIESAFHLATENRQALQLIMRDVLDQGGIDPKRRRDVLSPFLKECAELLEPFSTYNASRIRLALQSLLFLSTRFALSSKAELREITQEDNNTHAVVAAHLKWTALLTLGLDDLEKECP